jgi:feruloyl esterase
MRFATREAATVLALLLTGCALSAARAQDVTRTAADCDRLRALSLANTTIAVAEPVTGVFNVPGSRDTIRNLPAFCRVAGEIRPTADSHVAFEVWLPLEKWNGKFAGVGNGGWAGTISYAGQPIASLADQIRRGYAVASTNTGHVGNGGDARFAVGHPERLVDFGWRAVHEMTVAAKSVVQTFYGRAPARAYWIGCSTGGKQALTEAQRFPGDYDGIVAGAPANDWIPLMTGTAMRTVTAIGDSTRYLPRAALTLVHDAAMKSCDRIDGVEDGVLEDPRRCRFDPAVLQCASGSAPDAKCLTDAQVAAVKRIYAGVDDPTTGRKVSPGLEIGSELGWAGWTAPGRPFPIPISFFTWLVFEDSTWDWRTFDLASARDRQAWMTADQKFTPILSAIDPNLRAFRGRGGKLIQYHGWNDQLITPEHSVIYYESVLSFGASGRSKSETLADVQKFYRLFMAPGMGHCGGGDGPDVFDMERALEDWVERGVAPDSVIATRRGQNGAPNRSRPLCPYPKVAAYKGEGDINDSAKFACRDPGVSGIR